MIMQLLIIPIRYDAAIYVGMSRDSGFRGNDGWVIPANCTRGPNFTRSCLPWVPAFAGATVS